MTDFPARMTEGRAPDRGRRVGRRQAPAVATWIAAGLVAAGVAGCGNAGAPDGTTEAPRTTAETARFTGTAAPHLPPAMGALTNRPDATAAPTIELPPEPRPPDCIDVTPGVRRETRCCTAALRALLTPSEVRAACPTAGPYAYEELVDGRSCLFFFARGDAIVSVIPASELEGKRAEIARAPGFALLPELVEKLAGAGAPAPVDAFRVRHGKDLSPVEERTWVRVGDRGLVIALRPRVCGAHAMASLVDAVALRFAAGAGGTPRAAPAATDLPALVPGPGTAALPPFAGGTVEPVPPAPPAKTTSRPDDPRR